MARIYPIIRAMKEAAAADEVLTAQITDGAYEHRLPAPPAKTRWSRLVIRQLETPLREMPHGVTLVPVQAMIQCCGYGDPNLLLEAAHERLRGVLEALRPSSEHGSAYLDIDRQTRPSAPYYDEKTNSFSSTATYLVALHN